MKPQINDAVSILAPDTKVNVEKVLTAEAQQFLTALHRKFDKQRRQLLQKRHERQLQINQGADPGFLPETAYIRQDPNWQTSPLPADLQKRWVEITGPTDKKMMINALNSGADVFMADFEDANSPTWKNMIEGQENLIEAVTGTLSFTSPEGKSYSLKDQTATLMVRPRGWHLVEKHLLIDGEPISASLFDFGLAFFHNAKTLLKKNSGPYYYLPKLENHLEARLWNEVFLFAQQEFSLPRGTIKATVLIETILAAFEMEEIIFELREHIVGLNAGRWDYIFSIIKKYQKRQLLLPDRNQITMAVPFMNAYAELLVHTCHKRGAHAMGGMAAFVPSRKDRTVNEAAFAKVSEDKLRESKIGFDGTWVAHPDLVPIAREVFADALKQKPHQKDLKLQENKAESDGLLSFKVPQGTITENGMRQNISVALQYLNAWLIGVGAAAIFNLMEDAATAEISRAQLWQWLHHPHAVLADGRRITEELYKTFATEELKKIEGIVHDGAAPNKLSKAKQLLDTLALSREFADFLTTSAYDMLEG